MPLVYCPADDMLFEVSQNLRCFSVSGRYCCYRKLETRQLVQKYMNTTLLVERPALAVRLDLCFRSVYFFYPGISSEPLNLSQQKFAR